MKQLYLYPLISLVFCCSQTRPVHKYLYRKLLPKKFLLKVFRSYPNPASGQKVYITTKSNKPKKVEIYNVLGKNVLSANLAGNELNISSLDPGIYIMKIQEGKSSATRKLGCKITFHLLLRKISVHTFVRHNNPMRNSRTFLLLLLPGI